MSKIVSIGTAVPAYVHQQGDILSFMQNVYAMAEEEKRKLKFLYRQSGIKKRYSVITDYSRPLSEWKFYPQSEGLEPFPALEQRMALFNKKAPQLSVDAIRKCMNGIISHKSITHLITVSCTGMSAPGLDLQVLELLDLDKNIFRTSVNFMGCYAAIHALKIADMICQTDKNANVMIVCTELCTLHFQREATLDNITSSMLFGDGSAAVLVSSDDFHHKGLHIDHFHSEIISNGKRDMAWEMSSTGFLMTLSNYIPELIEEDFKAIVQKTMQKQGSSIDVISDWCIHPGGKRILESIEKSVGISKEELLPSYNVLEDYGNLSSPTILFVLKDIMERKKNINKLFGAAFGPGLTVETFTASYQ